MEHLALEDVNKNYLNDSPDANLEFEAGEVVAVCGSSGSGKSALLHILAGSNICKSSVKCHGKIEIKLTESIEKQRCVRCWYKHVRLVPHQDLFVSSLTCEETVETYSRLSNDSNLPDSPSELSPSLVDSLEAQTNIGAKAELKKLSVLSAIASAPALILIDEPLFFLEEKSLKELGRRLSDFARNEERESLWKCSRCRSESKITRRIVVIALNSTCLTIEADGYLEFIDKFVLLSRSKQIIFYGRIDDALNTFGLSSRKELVHYLDERERDMDHLADENKHLHTRSKARGRKNSSVIVTLFIRHYYQIRNVPKQYLRVIIERILIFTLLAFIFQNPNSRSALIGMYFFLPINQTSNVILFTSTESFANKELTIIERDRFHLLYSSWDVMLVKYIIMSIVNIIPALVYLPVIFYIAEIRNRSSFPLFVLANILSILCSNAVGLFIASSSKDIFIRNLWLFGLTTVFATFGGIHTAANYQLPWTIRWIQYLSPTFYLFLITIRLEFNDSEIENVLAIGRFILDTGEAFGALAALTAGYLLCAFLALYLSTMPRRLLF